MASNVDIILTAVDQASQTVKDVGKEIEGIEKKSFDLSKAFDGLAIAGGLAFAGLAAAAVAAGAIIFDSIGVAAEWEVTVGKLDAVQKAMGEKTGFTTDEILEQASALQKITRFSDDVIVSGQTILATFTNIQEDAFERTTELALDMAEVFGQSVPGAATMLGKAIDDPINGMAALRRVGVSLSEEQVELISSMQEAGDVAGAQAALLDVLETQVGGTARAVGETFVGQMEQAKNAMGDIQKEIGGALLPVLTDLATQFNEWLQDPEVQAALANLVEGIKNLGEKVAEWIPVALEHIEKAWNFLKENDEILVGILAALGVAFIAFGIKAAIALAPIVAPMLLVIAIMALIGLAVAGLLKIWNDDWGGIRTFLTDTWENKLKPIFDTLRTWLEENVPIAIEKLREVWERVWGKIQEVIDFVFGQISLIFEAFKLAFEGDWEGFGEKLREVWDNAWEKVKEIFNNVKDWFAEVIPKVIETIVNFFKDTDWKQLGIDIIMGLINGIKSMIGNVSSVVKNVAGAIGDAFKGFFGIGSPSKLMAEIGQNLMEGFALGIKSKDDLPARAAGEAALGVSRSMVNHYNLTINTSAPHEPIIDDFNMMRSWAGA